MPKKNKKSVLNAVKDCKAGLHKNPIARKFKDIAIYTPSEKTAISVRDGVIEYLGSELNVEPFDSIFTVYRSPATIANAAMKMLSIPLTYEHVSLEEPAPDTGSIVERAEMVDFIDEETNTKIAIKNKLILRKEDEALLIERKELSLGYFADLVKHKIYDYEQVNIIPHHLAAVKSGRCGALCSFLDKKFNKKENKNMKIFLDEQGEVSLEKILEILQMLPEAVKSVPLDKLKEYIPMFEEILVSAKGKEPAEPEGIIEGNKDEDPSDEDKEGMKDEDPSDEDKEGMKDEDKEDDKKDFSDASFLDKMNKFADAQVKAYASIVNKAKVFLSDTYNYADKTAKEVMCDCLKTQSTSKFNDEELPVAFKLLKKSSNYQAFGSNQEEDKFDKIGNKEL